MNFLFDKSAGIMFGEIKEILNKLIEVLKKVYKY